MAEDGFNNREDTMWDVTDAYRWFSKHCIKTVICSQNRILLVTVSVFKGSFFFVLVLFLL